MPAKLVVFSFPLKKFTVLRFIKCCFIILGFWAYFRKPYKIAT